MSEEARERGRVLACACFRGRGQGATDPACAREKVSSGHTWDEADARRTHEDHRHIHCIDTAPSLWVDLEDPVLVADRVRLVSDIDNCQGASLVNAARQGRRKIGRTDTADDDRCKVKLRRAERNSLRCELDAKRKERRVPAGNSVGELAGPWRTNDTDDTAETEEADLERVVVEGRGVEEESQAGPCRSTRQSAEVCGNTESCRKRRSTYTRRP